MTEDLRTASHPHNAGFPSAAAAAAAALSRLSDLVKKSFQIQASLARQSVDLTWATLAGDLDRTSANKAYVESVSRESVRYWRAISELSIDYATDLVTLGKSMSTAVVREVSAAGRKHGTRRTPDTAAGSAESTPHLVVAEERDSQRTLSPADEGPSSRGSDHDASISEDGRGPRHSA